LYIYSVIKKREMEILNKIKSISEEIKSLEEKFKRDKENLEYHYQSLKSQILEKELGLSIGDEVTLCIEEYRDDRISCFAVKQEAQCFITGVEIQKDEKGETFLVPILKKKDKKKSIYHNWYLTWSLKKDGVTILSHKAEQFIIPEKYTEKQLQDLRNRLLQAQKI